MNTTFPTQNAILTQKTKKQITINIDENTIDYFKVQAENSGIPYQTLINLYLSDCVTQKMRTPAFMEIMRG